MMVAFQMVMAGGFQIQTGKPLADAFRTGAVASNNGFIIGYSVFLFAFYSFAVYTSFNAYREFKYMLHGKNSSGSGTFGTGRGRQMNNPLDYGSLK